MTDRTQANASHCPVLLDQVVKLLVPPGKSYPNGGQFLDCTFGGGGHSEALLQAGEKIFLYAIDCDPLAKKRAQEFSLKYENFRFYQMNFVEVGCLKLPQLDGVLMDLGVSSFQLDDESRGFSFKHHVPLDMRMDNSRGIRAEEFLRTADERDLITAIRDYGEEEQWRKVVNTIVENRAGRSISYCDTFAKMVANCFSKDPRQKIHPATKTFQGIRIFINGELRALEMALPVLFDKLAVGGRLILVSFHSLEDRIVKKFFNAMAGKAIDKFDSQSVQERVVFAKILTKKPILPSESEIKNNPRSRSAKLRALEKVKSCGTKK
ncbi:MAG: 16S rRNA (cytosine(1402)-N(4))-methyltransferase RsmH [Puniceicoccales bacterium]|jgi:16S rRNA (cytosine1402-N4)-methyltransferase|nr:16S rRNA (cytosine(1402)-N(4))-methyltransferase RsmH [Puniceicoccales bacterium]